MLLNIDVALDYECTEALSILLQIEAADGDGQTIRKAGLDIEGDPSTRMIEGDEGIGSRRWIWSERDFTARYKAQVEVTRQPFKLAELEREPLVRLPADVVKYIFASRYCDPIAFGSVAIEKFGGIPSGKTMAAMRDWVEENFTYDSRASDASTTGFDTWEKRAGVCRDYAHVMISLARSLSVPARMVSVYAPDVNPQDFHAVAELWLGGEWRLVDATGMAHPHQMVRVGVGRDAADISFLTAFAPVNLKSQSVQVSRET
ncbi:transglutaminase family protein [Ahrensia sp. R2A130]|uniref:transglutaminase-like domain-containing protein n=1 Tax=Ahrensia sp. R2A130 TaxID=744979 RepID=UPI0001E094A1|nr:transglutaminase family protein [Ahrensia sp. R2A130]EFL88357.1 transglutaminase family protein [Ahrensia sp. R2A130]